MMTDRSFTQKFQELDWVGIVLTACMYVCFILAFTFGGAIWAWNDGQVIALIVLFLIFTVAFAASQHFKLFTTEENRLFPCEFIRDPQLVLLYVCMACMGAALFVSIYYIPLYFLFVHGDSGVEAAVRLLPFVCVYVTSILVCGYALPRVGYHMVWYLFSGILLICGGAAMHTIKADSTPAKVYGFSVLIALGLMTSQASYSVAAQLVSARRGADVIQFYNISQGQSQLIGLVIASAIFQSTAFDGMKSVLAGTGLSNEEIQTAIAGATSSVLEQLSPNLRSKALDVIVKSIGNEWILVIAAGAIQTLCSVFLLRGKHVDGKHQ
jgi:hypothetical protein